MPSQPSVLVIDDDLGTRETFERVLRLAGLAATAAASGEEGVRLAQSLRPDLLLIDLCMPEMGGIDVIKTLHQGGHYAPFILMSHWNDTPTTVEAMQLGAADVLDKSRNIDELVAAIRAALARRPPTLMTVGGWPTPWFRRAASAEPRSAAQRWALYVRRACEADADVRTVEGLADWLNISPSRFNEACWLLGIPPHEARDLARMLRVVIKGAGQRHRFPTLLDVSERRTLEKLLDRAGVGSLTADGTMSVGEFLRCQRFVLQDNDGLEALRRRLLSDPPEWVG
jgi:DNA-binding response OmpR family regulator